MKHENQFPTNNKRLDHRELNPIKGENQLTSQCEIQYCSGHMWEKETQE